MDRLTRLEEALSTGWEAADLAMYLAVERVQELGRATVRRVLHQPPGEAALTAWEAPLADPAGYGPDATPDD